MIGVNSANAGNVTLDGLVAITESSGVNPTNSEDGKVYVWNGSDAVVATGQGNFVKSSQAKLTLSVSASTEHALSTLEGLTFNVTINSATADGYSKIRLAAPNTVLPNNQAVGTAGMDVAIGSITITSGAIVYSSTLGETAKNDGLYFFFSLDPKGEHGEDSDATEGAKKYGTIAVTFTKANG